MKLPVALAGILLLFASGGAHANGRYPIANQLVVSPANPTHLTLRTTFGLVLSEDGGKHFGWVCEKAAGFVNNEDPPVEVSGDGSIFVASSQALNISHDGGCVWDQAVPDLTIVDADVDASNPKRAVAIASLYAAGKTSSGLEETLDNGVSWHALGTAFDGLPATVAIAPSSPSTIYASGTSTTDLTPLISVSTDAGTTWNSYPLNVANITVPFIAAVDPHDPKIVYVRAPTSAGTDVLVVTTDAGAHFRTIFQAQGGLYGFALSPDGEQIAVGGPNDSLSIASAPDYAFEQRADLRPLCLKWAAAGLYACADEANFQFSLGLSTDNGAHFDALFHKRDLSLKACPMSTPTGLYCPQAWVGEQLVLGIDAGAPEPTDAGDASDASDRGGATSAADAGPSEATAGTGGATSQNQGGAAVTPISSHGAKSSSNGCAFSARERRDGARLWLTLLGVVIACAGARRGRGSSF